MSAQTDMDSLLEGYIKHLEFGAGRSPYHARNCSSDIRAFLAFLREVRICSLDHVSRYTIRAYLARLQEKGIARTSVQRKVSTLKTFYRYLGWENLTDINPVAAVSAPKPEKRLPQFFTTYEMKQLLGTPDTSTVQGVRDKAILEVLYATGVRVSELVSLDLEDINFNSRLIKVWGKGFKEREVLMGGKAVKALELYLSESRPRFENGDGKALFLQQRGERTGYLRVQYQRGERIGVRCVQNLVKNYARLSGLDMKVHPHMIRHSFATHLLDGGADLRVVQELLGHTLLSSTQIYTHISLANLRHSYLKAHPRGNNNRLDYGTMKDLEFVPGRGVTGCRPSTRKVKPLGKVPAMVQDKRSTPSRNTAHEREALLQYLDSATYPIDGEKPGLQYLIGQLWNCDHTLPIVTCTTLDLNPGSTYAQAVRKMANGPMEKYISRSEAAKVLGIYARSVNRLARRGVIPAVKIAGCWVLSRRFVEDRAITYGGRRGRPRSKRKYTKKGVGEVTAQIRIGRGRTVQSTTCPTVS